LLVKKTRMSPLHALADLSRATLMVQWLFFPEIKLLSNIRELRWGVFPPVLLSADLGLRDVTYFPIVPV